MERTEVAMGVVIGLVVYLLGVGIHEAAMEAFLALIRYNQLRGAACKDRAKLEIGPKITTFETLSE